MKLSEEALLLLANAEDWIYNHRCWRCIHYQEGKVYSPAKHNALQRAATADAVVITTDLTEH